MRFFLLTLIAVLVMATPVPSFANDPHAGSGLPVPRFVSTRSESINVRTGPGERYPVKWILRKKSMPVEVIGEYDNWRKIKDWEGAEGWVHQAMLSGRRYVVVYPDKTILRKGANIKAEGKAEVAVGVIARLEECVPNWCHLTMEKAEGWVLRSALWGLKPEEKLD
jgi:SH3-like domain-containing protein